MSAALGALSAVGILGVAVLLGLLGSKLARVSLNFTAVALHGGMGILVAAAAWLTGLTGIPIVFLLPVVALGGLFAVVVTLAARENESGEIRGAIFAGILTLLVYVPVVSIVFALWYDPFSTGIGLLDLGAALPTEVAAGSATLAVLLLGSHRSRSSRNAREVGPPADRWQLSWIAAGLVVAWLAWLIGLELSIDRLTPLILANGSLMALSSAVAWAVVERARHRTNTVSGTVLGLLAGLAAATPAAGYLEPLLAVITALVVGAIAALISGRVTQSASRRICGVLVAGGATSLLLLGFLAKDVGFIYTGQPELFFGQLVSVIGAGGGGFVVALLVTLVARRFSTPSRRPAAGTRRH